MASENTPLLALETSDEDPSAIERSQSQSGHTIHHQGSKRLPSDLLTTISKHWSSWKVVYICAAFVFIIGIPEFMRAAPFHRMLELGVCRDYYKSVDPKVIAPDGDIAENLCKLNEIQTRLARLKSVAGAIGILPGLLLAVPYGIMADHRSRRFVLTLGLIGALLAETWVGLVLRLWNIFPVTAIFFFPLFLCIGGGGPVLSAVLLAVVADVTPTQYLTRVLFLLTVVNLVTELVSPPVGSFLMDHFDAYVSYAATIPLRIASFLFLLIIPETLSKLKNIERCASEYTSTTKIDDIHEPPKKGPLREKVDRLLSHIRMDIIPLITRGPVVLALLAILVGSFARTVSEFLLQYMTIRFDWRWSQAAYLISFAAAVHITLLCTILPAVHACLGRVYSNPDTANLVLAKGSIFFLILGPIVIGFADKAPGIYIGIVIYTLGSGFPAAVCSYLTSIVPKHETALLYTMISIFTSLGAMTGAPLMALTFAAGIGRSGVPRGLPFFVGAALYFISGFGVWFLKTPQNATDGQRDKNSES